MDYHLAFTLSVADLLLISRTSDSNEDQNTKLIVDGALDDCPQLTVKSNILIREDKTLYLFLTKLWVTEGYEI